MEDQMQGHGHGHGGDHGHGGEGEMQMMDHRRGGGIGMGNMGGNNMGGGNMGSGNIGNNMGGDRPRSQRDMLRQQEIDCYEEELSRLDDTFPYARQALELEVHRVRGGVPDMIDVIHTRKCKVRCRVAIPQDEFPGINFVGKLLGQGGSTLKKLQEDCSVKMAILGRGSMRDQQKEQEAFESGDPKYQHLKQPLHLQIDCLDAPEEAYYRISRAVYEVKTIMTPDPNEMANMYGPPMGGGMMPYGGRGRGRGGFGGGGGGGGYGGGFGGPGYDGAGDMGGFRGRGGRGGRGFGRGGPRGGGRGGASADNGQGFGEEYGGRTEWIR